jgi:hypothetical protein
MMAMGRNESLVIMHKIVGASILTAPAATSSRQYVNGCAEPAGTAIRRMACANALKNDASLPFVLCVPPTLDAPALADNLEDYLIRNSETA